MIERQIESPMPMPLGFVVKKASNKRSMVFPGPESSTAISTVPGVARRSSKQAANAQPTRGTMIAWSPAWHLAIAGRVRQWRIAKEW